MPERLMENKKRLGWVPNTNRSGLIPVWIVDSISGCDSTIIEHSGIIEARLGTLDDSEIVSIDPSKDKILNVFQSNGNGCQKITVEFKEKGGNRIEDVFVPTA